MFDIFGDEITFDRRPVATLRPGLLATLRQEVESFLYGTPDGFIREEDHEAAVRDVEEDAKKRGIKIGRADAKTELEAEHRNALAMERALAFKLGKRAGAEAAGKLAEVAKLDALLAHVSAVEADLRAALNGVRVEGKVRPRQLKAAEFKRVVRESFLALGDAKRKFTAD